ncbi:hypothetical protein HK098_008038, partial [Nowakowskiella sp. JEL0407]
MNRRQSGDFYRPAPRVFQPSPPALRTQYHQRIRPTSQTPPKPQPTQPTTHVPQPQKLNLKLTASHLESQLHDTYLYSPQSKSNKESKSHAELLQIAPITLESKFPPPELLLNGSVFFSEEWDNKDSWLKFLRYQYSEEFGIGWKEMNDDKTKTIIPKDSKLAWFGGLYINQKIQCTERVQSTDGSTSQDNEINTKTTTKSVLYCVRGVEDFLYNWFDCRNLESLHTPEKIVSGRIGSELELSHTTKSRSPLYL